MPTEKSKKFWQSRTVWLNTLTALGTIIAAWQGVLPPGAAAAIAIASSVVNLGLRFVTALPLD